MARFFFYLLATLYIFVIFASIYGFFVDEITIFNFSLSGWSKNLLCIFGLLVASIASAYPMVSAVYKAFNNSKD